MIMSYVVRLVDSALGQGRLAGEVQHVATGDRTPVRSAEELVAALLRGASGVRSSGADLAEGDQR